MRTGKAVYVYCYSGDLAFEHTALQQLSGAAAASAAAAAFASVINPDSVDDA